MLHRYKYDRFGMSTFHVKMPLRILIFFSILGYNVMWILETVKIIVVLAQDYINRNFANLTSLKKLTNVEKINPFANMGFHV